MLLQAGENPARQFLSGNDAKTENYSLSITIYPETAKKTPKMFFGFFFGFFFGLVCWMFVLLVSEYFLSIPLVQE